MTEQVRGSPQQSDARSLLVPGGIVREEGGELLGLVMDEGGEGGRRVRSHEDRGHAELGGRLQVALGVLEEGGDAGVDAVGGVVQLMAHWARR